MGPSRFAEVDDAADAAAAVAEKEKERELEGVVRVLLEVALPGAEAGRGRRELAGVVRGQVAVPLVGGLVQLGFGGTTEADVGQWARDALEGMFAR